MTPRRVAIVAGGHLACTVLQPCSPAVFTTANLGGITVSPLELERIVDGHPAVYESAAVAVQPDGEGAKRLVVFIVPDAVGGATDDGLDVDAPISDVDSDAIKSELQAMVSGGLNPLFKIFRVIIVDELPHTASGKLIRRALRDGMRPGT